MQFWRNGVEIGKSVSSPGIQHKSVCICASILHQKDSISLHLSNTLSQQECSSAHVHSPDSQHSHQDSRIISLQPWCNVVNHFSLSSALGLQRECHCYPRLDIAEDERSRTNLSVPANSLPADIDLGEVARVPGAAAATDTFSNDAMATARLESVVDDVCEQVTANVMCSLLEVGSMFVTSEGALEYLCCVEDQEAAASTPPPISAHADGSRRWDRWAGSIHVQQNLFVNTSREFAVAEIRGNCRSLSVSKDDTGRRT
eukprot:763992-Hanusia_phi.AAC.1